MEGQLTEQGIIQRAFELAASGRFHDVRTLEKALRDEGYTQAIDHLSSRSLRLQLKALMPRRSASGTLAAANISGQA